MMEGEKEAAALQCVKGEREVVHGGVRRRGAESGGGGSMRSEEGDGPGWARPKWVASWATTVGKQRKSFGLGKGFLG
jgi:hypothetical protein